MVVPCCLHVVSLLQLTVYIALNDYRANRLEDEGSDFDGSGGEEDSLNSADVADMVMGGDSSDDGEGPSGAAGGASARRGRPPSAAKGGRGSATKSKKVESDEDDGFDEDSDEGSDDEGLVPLEEDSPDEGVVKAKRGRGARVSGVS